MKDPLNQVHIDAAEPGDPLDLTMQTPTTANEVNANYHQKQVQSLFDQEQAQSLFDLFPPPGNTIERLQGYSLTPPSSVVVNTQGRESENPEVPGSRLARVWYPRPRPCGVAINTLVALINWLGIPKF